MKMVNEVFAEITTERKVFVVGVHESPVTNHQSLF